MAKKGYRVIVVGRGAVGQEMLRVLRQRRFPAREIKVLATSAGEISVDGQAYAVAAARIEEFEQFDLALFAGTEGEKGAAVTLSPGAIEHGVIVIDNGNDFRMDPNVPLVIPEVNPEDLEQHQGLITNPNCSTIQMLVALKPLHDRARIKRVVVASYQSCSGAGSRAVAQLERETEASVRGESAPLEAFPHPIAGNVIPHIGRFSDSGYASEEEKFVHESRKILHEPDLAVTATAVRVPTRIGHGEAVNVEFEQPLSPEEARQILSRAPGVVVCDNPAENEYPMPLDVEGKDEVYVGRIRSDPTVPHGLNLWIVGDNLRKGAALNAVQIAETMIEKGLL